MSAAEALAAVGVRIAVERDPDPRVALLFERRFGDPLPDFPHHVVARADALDSAPLAYIHFTAHGRALLGGGACVDSRALKRLDRATRAALKREGGAYAATLRWAIANFSGSCDAVFGYCGDALAERVDLAVGFEKTGHPRVLVKWNRDIAPDDADRLLAEIVALGAF